MKSLKIASIIFVLLVIAVVTLLGFCPIAQEDWTSIQALRKFYNKKNRLK